MGDNTIMGDGRYRLGAGAAVGALLLALGAPALGQDGAAAPETEAEVRETPAVLQADEVEYQDAREIVIARGNVEVAQGERILLADEIRYNTRSDVITATGNVTLLQPTGEVIFGDQVRVTGDLREGTIEAFRMLLTDNSRLAAANAVRVDDNRTDMNRAVYSPCDICEDDPDSAPLWQMRATRVIHDQDAQTVYYRHARLELFDVPLFYTPYFSHPDPTAERQTGLLAPTVGFSNTLGANAQVPYYFVLSDQVDFTFEPIVTTGASQVAMGTYRQETSNGRFSVTGSLTVANSLEPATAGNVDVRRRDADIEEGDLRGHIRADGRFDIDDNWRWGFDIARASDDAYLRRYNLGYQRTLQSDLFVERFEGRNYFTAQGLSFQGLERPDDEHEEPFVLPEARYSYLSDPDYWGGHLIGELGTLNLMRTEGRDTQRLSGTLGWERSHVEDLGGRITVTALTNIDLYAFQDTVDGTDRIDVSSERGESGTAGRFFPQAAVSYAYPVTRSTWLGTEVVEPRVQAVVGPNGGNDGGIPNETSRTFEFSAGNLFELDRLPGRDRVSSGQRIDYGVDYTYTTPSGGGTATARLGQSYRLNTDDALPASVGEEDGFSDIVGRFSVSPFRYFSTRYDFRADEDTLQLKRSDYGISVGPEALRLDASYVYQANDEEVADRFETREQIDLSLSSRFARYWVISARHRYDLEEDTPLSTRVGLRYQDECFLFGLSAQRRNFDRADVDDDVSVMLTIGFNNLGSFGTGVF